jgi:hypothetical protein
MVAERIEEKGLLQGKIGSFDSAAKLVWVSNVVNTTRGCILLVPLCVGSDM